MHIATYRFAAGFVAGKSVLDYGCGTGYGAFILAEKANKVTAVDVSMEALKYARDHHASDNIVFTTPEKVSSERYDVITMFQVIEHIADAKRTLTEIKSLLYSDGYLLISTPDKTNRLLGFIQNPWNVFHIREFSPGSLSEMLSRYFTRVELLKIGSKSDLALKEIARTKKQRIITLPCTLFIYPRCLRVLLLKLQAKLFTILKHSNSKIEKHISHDFRINHSEDDIDINNVVRYSTDLLAICSDLPV